MDDSSAEKYLKWLAAQLRTNDTALVQVVIKSLMSVLRFDSYRLKFYNETDGVEGLNGLVDDKAANFQMQYQVIFCYWLLTFNADIAGDIPKYGRPFFAPTPTLFSYFFYEKYSDLRTSDFTYPI